MTRDDILVVIAGGRSVVWQGRILARPEDVPSEETLAAVPDYRLTQLAAIDAQIAALTADRAALAGDAPKPSKGKP